jgi:release factor glutamine methyltransferase
MPTPDVRDLLRTATSALAAAGVASPRVDAELLLAHVLRLSRTQLLVQDVLSEHNADRFADLISQRTQGIPLQHLTGSAPFRHLEIEVGPGVFIPRPETELILDLARSELAAAGLVVDLCAGSGAIALAVANEYPSATVIAVEGSVAAGEWLHRNADIRATAGDRRIEVLISDIGAPQLLSDQSGQVDVVLANPPYVPERIKPQLSAEVGHDPEQAVYAGEDGLALMSTLITAAARLLRPGGFFAVEHDDSHAEAVPNLLEESGDWRAVADHTDLAGRPRFATAVRR